MGGDTVVDEKGVERNYSTRTVQVEISDHVCFKYEQ